MTWLTCESLGLALSRAKYNLGIEVEDLARFAGCSVDEVCRAMCGVNHGMSADAMERVQSMLGVVWPPEPPNADKTPWLKKRIENARDRAFLVPMHKGKIKAARKMIADGELTLCSTDDGSEYPMLTVMGPPNPSR